MHEEARDRIQPDNLRFTPSEVDRGYGVTVHSDPEKPHSGHYRHCMGRKLSISYHLTSFRAKYLGLVKMFGMQA